MANYMLGMNAKIYMDTSVPLTGSNQAAWIAGPPDELTNVRDVTLNLETGEADITTRANSGWRATAPTLKDGSVDFEMVWKTTDTLFDEIETAWSAGTEISFFVTDGGLATGFKGLLSNMTVTNLSRSEPLDGAVMYSVTLKPSSYSEWYEVPA